MSLVAQFATLFAGNPAAVGSWTGGCVREPVTHRTWHDHLSGVRPVGIYPMVNLNGDTVVGWGCVDIDFDDFGLARRLVAALAHVGIPAHVEHTNARWHVWVFPEDEWVPAVTMRRALLAACKVIGYDPKEVNPKAETLDGLEFGNYVRLPYPGGGIHRYFVTDEGRRQPCRGFLESTLQMGLADTAALRTASGMWTPPPRPNRVEFDSTVRYDNLDGLSAYAKRIIDEGPLNGADRSGTLVRLAYRMAEDGATPSEALAALQAADARWGKFRDRKDGLEQLERIVDKAFS